MHASVLEPANPCIFTLMVRKRSNWCGAFGRLVVKHLLVAGQKRPWIAVFTPLRSDFRAMDAHFECPAVRHLLCAALAAMDDFRKATPFVHVPKHAGKHDLVVEGNPPIFSSCQKWSYAAMANFCLGVMPPSAMFGRSWL